MFAPEKTADDSFKDRSMQTNDIDAIASTVLLGSIVLSKVADAMKTTQAFVARRSIFRRRRRRRWRRPIRLTGDDVSAHAAIDSAMKSKALRDQPLDDRGSSSRIEKGFDPVDDRRRTVGQTRYDFHVRVGKGRGDRKKDRGKPDKNERGGGAGVSF